MNDMNEEKEADKINMSELEKTYFKLTFLRDEFNKQIKALEEHNKTLDTRIKGFVAHIDEIGKAPDRVKDKVEQNLNHLLNIVVDKTADRLVEKTQEDVTKSMKELGDATAKTTRALNDARDRLTTKPIWWHLAFGAGSLSCALIVFFILHFFVFNKRVDTIVLTEDIHHKLARGTQFNTFLSKLSIKQINAISEILFKDKNPNDVFNKEYKD